MKSKPILQARFLSPAQLKSALGKAAPTDRKIVQIATANDGDTCHILALCNDGTVWELIEQWEKYPSIPQGDAS